MIVTFTVDGATVAEVEAQADIALRVFAAGRKVNWVKVSANPLLRSAEGILTWEGHVEAEIETDLECVDRCCRGCGHRRSQHRMTDGDEFSTVTPELWCFGGSQTIGCICEAFT